MKKTIWLVVSCFLLFIISCESQRERSRNVIIYSNDLGTEDVVAKDIVLENEYLELRFMPETTEIILKNKANGVEWRSNPEGNDSLADTVTRYLQKSVFALEYADVTGVGQTLYSSEQSVDIGAYSYEIVDGGLEVNYSVGNIERIYIIPPAVPEERMNEFMDKMSAGDKRLVGQGYRLYDINNLRRDDDKTQLLATYPDLARRNIYVLRSTALEYQKAEYEEIFETVGYTYDDYLQDVSLYPTSGGKERPAFNVSLRYTLDGKSLVLDVPFDKIAYRGSYPMVKLHILPYLGAGGVNDKGYLLVPDGSGALIYFNNGKQNQLGYTNFVYGWDEGQKREAVINDNKAPFPVFGIQKNGNALACVIENGASYANVLANVAGRNSSYSNVFARFDMVHSALMNISGRSERSVYQYERTLPANEKITLRYIVCGQDGYVGMAKEYRSWLLNKFPSLKRSNKKGVPIAVEIPGAVNKTQHRLGIPFDLPLKLTSYNEATGMIKDFNEFGWKDVQIKLNGWFNRSVDHTIPTKIKLINELGSKKDFRNLIAAAQQNGYVVYPEVDFFLIRDKKPFDGFNLYRDAARYLNRERMQRYPFSFVWFGERTRWGKLNYVARPEKMMSMIDNFVYKIPDLGVQNIAFRNIGSRLTGNYNEKQHVSREASVKMRQEKLAELNKAGIGVMLLAGHAYAAPYADFIVNMMLDDQKYGITDVSVPFYPIALHGLVPYTGNAINLAEDYTKNLLKTIESGAGLYFSFMTEETSVLQETKFRQFYANEYNKWVGDADSLYKQFTNNFGNLYNQDIVDHKILSYGVTLTEYEDGTRVVVNASDAAVNYNNRNINSDSFVVLKRGE
jgi:hypothetical protein